MPFLLIFFVLVVLFVCLAAFYLIKKEVEVNVILEKRGANIVIFVLSLISLVIYSGLFLNIGRYVSDHNANIFLIVGGSFWLNMYWFMLGILFVLCLITGFKLIKRSK